MPSSGRTSAGTSVVVASACAFAMIATQVAGKATRDVLFLLNFDISALPLVLMASALLSIGAVLLTSREIASRGPLRVIPPFFIASGVLLVAEWFLATRDARLAAVVVYLHIASVGSILISGFWSIINEHFDPRTAKQSIGRIVGSATIGGLFGGLLAERVGAHTSVLWVLPVVAALHVVCGTLLFRLRPAGDTAGVASRTAPRRDREPPRESGFRVLARVGYLRNLALIVLLGNLAATLIDYLFKAHAVESFAGGANLSRFFAVFYTAVSVMTLVVQAGMTRRLLEGIGIANTMAVRPALVTVGGLVTLPVIGLVGLGILRALEGIVQSSLFRSGYELLFTPVTPDQKRSAKTIVDVGADRVGDILGGAVIRAVILLPAAVSEPALVVLAVAISLAGFMIARALRRGYIRALETSLINRASVLDIMSNEAAGMRTMMMESFTGIDLSLEIDGIRLSELRGLTPVSPADASASDKESAARTEALTAPLSPVSDPEIASLMSLRSGDANRVHAELRRTRTLGPTLVAQVISLLAWDEVNGWASRALAKVAPKITGQLIDRLLDPDEDFAIRRRIPRILSTCTTSRAFEGLMAALADKRFEVRFQSGRALARIHDQRPSLPVDRDAVYAAVMRETRVDKSLWKDQELIDQPAVDDAPVLIEDALRAQTSRRMEHLFTLLSLVVPRAPLEIAFKGLLTSDAVLRGTGLEYVESVLPREIWNSLRPFLDDTREGAAPERPREEILEDLMRSSQSVELKLREIRKRIQES